MWRYYHNVRRLSIDDDAVKHVFAFWIAQNFLKTFD